MKRLYMVSAINRLVDEDVLVPIFVKKADKCQCFFLTKRGVHTPSKLILFLLDVHEECSDAAWPTWV